MLESFTECPETSWNDLNIGRCEDLKACSEDLKDYVETLRNWARIWGIKIPFIKDPTYDYRRFISLLLEAFADMYKNAWYSTEKAYGKLCGKDRLKKKRRGENPEQ